MPPGERIGIFFRKVSPEAPLAEGVYLRLDGPDFQPELPVETVGEPIASHRETRLQTVPYPVVREFILQHVAVAPTGRPHNSGRFAMLGLRPFCPRSALSWNGWTEWSRDESFRR